MDLACKRATDLVARYDGEEFMAILPNTRAKDAVLVAEKMRHAVESLNEEYSTSNLGKVTISLGVYSSLPKNEEDSEIFIKNADDALYDAKEGGRNRVQLAK